MARDLVCSLNFGIENLFFSLTQASDKVNIWPLLRIFLSCLCLVAVCLSLSTTTVIIMHAHTQTGGP